MSNLSTQTLPDPSDVLWEMNNEKAKLFIPAMVYVGVLMLIGTFGNIVVVYFYGFKTKHTPSTGFIVSLAIFDIISCLVGMPMEIADLRFYFNFESVIACKALRVVTHFASIGSGLTLVMIAIDRYRRICKPFERQLNRKHVKVACVAIGVMSVVFSWPAALFNKVVSVDVDNDYGVTVEGHDCTTSREDNLKTYIFIFNVVYLVAFILITGILSVLYTFVGRQLYRHKKFRSYVAKKRRRTTRIKVSQAPNALQEDALLRTQNTDTTSSNVFEDPPDASESVADLREFVTHGMPEVESVRHSSSYTAVTKATGLTGITNRSKSLKSVTICDPSRNQVFSIEPRKGGNSRPTSGRNKDELSREPKVGNEADKPKQHTVNENSDIDMIYNDDPEISNFVGSRPESAGSFATFSSRPSSASFSYWDERAMMHQLNEDDDFDDTFIQSEDRGSALSRTPDAVLDTFNEILDGHDDIKRYPVDLALESEKTYISIPDETLASNVDIQMDIYAHQNEARPFSQASEESKTSKASTGRLRRFKRNTITPESSVDGSTITSTISSTVTDATLTSSVASRSSTVKRFKKLFKHSLKGGNMDSDTDKIKELKTKMLDINTIKYTMIMITVTVVFVVSFLPYLSLVIWRYNKDEHEANLMSDTELVLFQIGLRSIFLQSSLNPLIYGGFNSKFRAFFYTAFCTCCVMKRKLHMNLTKKSRDQSDSTSGS